MAAQSLGPNVRVPAAVLTEAAALTVMGSELMMLAKQAPLSANTLTLPGEPLNPNESADATIRRHIGTVANAPYVSVMQLHTFERCDENGGWTPTISYVGLVALPREQLTAEHTWVNAHQKAGFSEEHGDVVDLALEYMERELWRSNLVAGLLPDDFTYSEARVVYDLVAGTTYDPSSFTRDLKATDLVEETGEIRSTGRGRPAALVRFKTPDLTRSRKAKRKLAVD